MAANAELVLRVNQQLAFVRVQLQAAQRQIAQSNIQTRLAIHAHLDAALTHLHKAIALFIREIADHLGVKLRTRGDDVELLLTEISQLETIAPELNEWLQLRQQNHSWFNQCLLAGKNPNFVAHQFVDSHSDVLKAEPQSANNLIVSAKTADPLPLELLENWQQQLQFLIERQRDSLVEE